jgi:hypothetical protein
MAASADALTAFSNLSVLIVPDMEAGLACRDAYLNSDTHDMSLSAYQQQFFDRWARAEQALPPPAMFPGDRNGLGPVMSTSWPIDLVQDAATDCSVVASLCAGIARAERGHDQASPPGVIHMHC